MPFPELRPLGDAPAGSGGDRGDDHEAVWRGGPVILKSNAVDPPDCLRYALSLAADVVVTGLDTDAALDQASRVAKAFHPFLDQQLTALLAKTEKLAAAGRYELFKTSPHFDGTAQHPDWLGKENKRVKELAPEGSG